MTAPGITIGRRFSAATRLRVQLVFARALEALAETYQQQAAEFVRRLKPRLTVDEALQRYFREVNVPSAIEETVRSRALISLAGLIENPPRSETRASGSTIFWPNQLIDALRRRVQYVEETNLDCRLAASMSDEAVAATHVRMALQTAEVLAEETTPDQAIMLYIRTFNLPSIDAQGVFRTALSQWAELHPLPDEAQAPFHTPAPSGPGYKGRLELSSRPQFGLRVMV
ncbi:MAG TPA: hypothetical protein VFX42_08410 [Gemmatimonadales bacterium]|nr:hypothetical protein [Gemmatimonadales bacterium]